MASDFDSEEEMYSKLRDWLVDEAGCDVAYPVNEVSFKFTPADKGYFPDVIGRTYDNYDNPQYIGIEAKNLVRDSQKIINQSVSSLAFSHKAYLALPKKLFLSSSHEVQQRIEGRVRREHIGLLLVLKSRVDEHIPAPPQRTIQRIYNEVGEFFNKQKEADYFWDEECVWSNSQAEEFLDIFYSHALGDFSRPEKPKIKTGSERNTITLKGIYHEEIDTIFTIDSTSIKIDIHLSTNVQDIMDPLLGRLVENYFRNVFEVYSKRPGRWSKRGMLEYPSLKISTDEPDMSICFSSAPSETTLFNIGSLLKNVFLSDFSKSDSEAKTYSGGVTFSACMVKSTFQQYLEKNEEAVMELLHELLREGTELVAKFVDENEE